MKRWQSPSSDHKATASRPPIPYWFRDLDQGRSAAIAVLLFLVIALLTAFQLVLLRRRVHLAR